MRATEYSRKLDSSGRLVIPSALRQVLDLRTGDVCFYHIHEEDGKTYLCIECPRQENEIERAKRILRETGFLNDEEQ